MAFLKLPHQTAYYTGALRTNLDLRTLTRKLSRGGLDAKMTNGDLRIRYGEDEWLFGSWEPYGLGFTGWLAFTTHGDIGALSHKLATLGVRHRFDHSRPQDIGVVATRCVTQYDYRWNSGPGLAAYGGMPDIETFDETL